jgi:hypothetical protein
VACFAAGRAVLAIAADPTHRDSQYVYANAVVSLLQNPDFLFSFV